jgi:hypothetical protein
MWEFQAPFIQRITVSLPTTMRRLLTTAHRLQFTPGHNPCTYNQRLFTTHPSEYMLNQFRATDQFMTETMNRARITGATKDGVTTNIITTIGADPIDAAVLRR